MKRRIFLAVLTGLALSGAARAQGGAAQTPPDRITVEELKAAASGGKPVLVLDVRGVALTKIKGAAYIPLDQLESRLAEIPAGREIVTYCS